MLLGLFYVASRVGSVLSLDWFSWNPADWLSGVRMEDGMGKCVLLLGC